MAFDPTQRGVLRGILAAAAVTLVVLPAAVLWDASMRPALLPVQERLALALRWDALVLASLILCIGRVANHRFSTPADIDGSGLTAGTDRVRVLQAVLQNTLEQAAVAVLAHLLWAAAAPAEWFAAMPAAAVLFVAGRACFAAGYRGGAPGRAFGFALTFYPTVLLTVVAVAAMAWRGL